MTTMIKPLVSQTAADLMGRKVITLAETATMREAAVLLTGQDISGVPVVDAEGRCVGVLSALDFVRLWGRRDGVESHVRSHMTADRVTAGPGTPIADLAQMMIDAHIHRIIVVDERGTPIGIVTSTDVLAAVIYKGSGME